MIKDSVFWRQADLRIRAKSKLTYPEALAIFNSLFEEARSLGVFKKQSTRGLSFLKRSEKLPSFSICFTRALRTMGRKNP